MGEKVMVNREGEIPTEKGEITSELKRGVMSYKCTCGSQKLRPYLVINEWDEEEMKIICLNCCADSASKWEELAPVGDYVPSVNGDVDDNYKVDGEGEVVSVKKKPYEESKENLKKRFGKKNR